MAPLAQHQYDVSQLFAAGAIQRLRGGDGTFAAEENDCSSTASRETASSLLQRLRGGDGTFGVEDVECQSAPNSSPETSSSISFKGRQVVAPSFQEGSVPSREATPTPELPSFESICQATKAAESLPCKSSLASPAIFVSPSATPSTRAIRPSKTNSPLTSSAPPFSPLTGASLSGTPPTTRNNKLRSGASKNKSSHHNGKRCKTPGCTKASRGATDHCIAHGGGKRCIIESCTKSAVGSTKFCVKHGGGRRCSYAKCTKSARGGSTFCAKHGTMERKRKAALQTREQLLSAANESVLAMQTSPFSGVRASPAPSTSTLEAVVGNQVSQLYNNSSSDNGQIAVTRPQPNIGMPLMAPMTAVSSSAQLYLLHQGLLASQVLQQFSMLSNPGFAPSLPSTPNAAAAAVPGTLFGGASASEGTTHASPPHEDMKR